MSTTEIVVSLENVTKLEYVHFRPFFCSLVIRSSVTALLVEGVHAAAVGNGATPSASETAAPKTDISASGTTATSSATGAAQKDAVTGGQTGGSTTENSGVTAGTTAGQGGGTTGDTGGQGGGTGGGVGTAPGGDTVPAAAGASTTADAAGAATGGAASTTEAAGENIEDIFVIFCRFSYEELQELWIQILEIFLLHNMFCHRSLYSTQRHLTAICSIQCFNCRLIVCAFRRLKSQRVGRRAPAATRFIALVSIFRFFSFLRR